MPQPECKVCGAPARNLVEIKPIPIEIKGRVNGRPVSEDIKTTIGPWDIWLCDTHKHFFDDDKHQRISE